MTEIKPTESFLDIDPILDIKARGIRLLGVDIENVLTDYGDPGVLPGISEHMSSLLGNTAIVLITNNGDDEFIERVVSQLPEPVGCINPNKELGLRKKPSSSMFQYALDTGSYEIRPEQAAHVDDQLKAWIGIRRLGFGTFFWTNPVGEHQHRGVKALRLVEGLIRSIVVAKTNMVEMRRGDW